MNINYGTGVSQEELHKSQTDPRLVKDANAVRTLSAASYRIGPATKLDVSRISPEQADKRKNPALAGRLEAHLQTPAVEVEKGQDGYIVKEGGRKGTLFIDVSPDELRTKTGRLDGASQLWGQAIKAFGLPADASHQDVLEAFGTYAIDGFVGESYRLDGEYLNPKTPDEVKTALEQGATVSNRVRNFYVPKKRVEE